MSDTPAPPKPTNPFKRLFCRATSPLPSREDVWTLDGETLRVTLERAPELAPAGGALRLEDEGLPDRFLLVHGHDGSFHAYANHCGCGGLRIDPVPGEARIKCCSLMQSAYDYAGRVLGSHPDKGLTVYAVTKEDGVLTVDLSSGETMGKAE